MAYYEAIQNQPIGSTSPDGLGAYYATRHNQPIGSTADVAFGAYLGAAALLGLLAVAVFGGHPRQARR